MSFLGIESFSKLADSIYFRGVSTGGERSSSINRQGSQVLYITQYVSSSLDFVTTSGNSDAGSMAVSLEQHSLLPREGNTTIIITNITTGAERSGQGIPRVEMVIQLLQPDWLGDTALTVLVNGKPFDLDHSRSSSSDPKKPSFVAVSRGWSIGDTLSLRFQRAVRLVRLDDSRPAYATTYSFMFGDTLLAGLADVNATNSLRVTSFNASDWTVRADNEPSELRFFATTLLERVELVPLNRITTERYTVYYNLTIGRKS